MHVVRAFLPLFAAAAVLLTADSAWACLCPVSPNPRSDAQIRQEVEAEVRKARAVFSGRVVMTTTLFDTFEVDAVWKGDIPHRFVMSSGAVANPDGTITSSSCDYTFQEGKSYLVFAYGTSRESMRASQCTLTSVTANAADTVTHLNAVAPRRVPSAPRLRPGETYESVTRDAQGRLVILTSDLRTVVVDKEGEQTSFGDPALSDDRTAVAAQARFPNCCTSYDLPKQLVVYSAGREHRFRGVGLPIFQWHFADAGGRVAFGQEPAHFGCAVHYELREVESEKLLAEADIPQPCGQIPSPKPVKIPDWVTALISGRK